jgi:hypothetical protein
MRKTELKSKVRLAKKKKSSRARAVKYERETYIHFDDLRDLIYRAGENRKGAELKFYQNIHLFITETFLNASETVLVVKGDSSDDR